MWSFLKNLFKKKPLISEEIEEALYKGEPVKVLEKSYSFNSETRKFNEIKPDNTPTRKHPRYNND